MINSSDKETDLFRNEKKVHFNDKSEDRFN